jgi:hypothetical protein
MSVGIWCVLFTLAMISAGAEQFQPSAVFTDPIMTFTNKCALKEGTDFMRNAGIRSIKLWYFIFCLFFLFLILCLG